MPDTPLDPRLARYARQIQFADFGGVAGQEALLSARVVLVGVGALGSHIADTLARAGIGHLVLADRDFVELNNLQRQALYDEDDIAQNLPKAEAAARKLRRINSTITVEPRIMDVTPGNIEALIAGADVVLDGTDNFRTRYLVNDACIKHGIPWVYGGVLAGYGVTMTIVPGKTPCLRCLFPQMPPPGSTPTSDVAGILGPVVKVIGSLEAAEALKLLTGRGRLNPGLVNIDVWESHIEVVPVLQRVPSCPACGRRQFDHLEAATGLQETTLYGRNAVHIPAPAEHAPRLGELAERLQPIADTLDVNPYLLHATVEGYEFYVFPDGRAVIKGTEDRERAKALYDQYIR